MYEAFFNLQDSPFALTPDPRFLFRAKGHHDILASLLFGITSQKGIMALLGDVGTGKTTLCRALVKELPAAVQAVLILDPHVSDTELLETILEGVGVPHGAQTKGELMVVLGEYLQAAGAEGRTIVVIVDEAQQMSVERLEQIRLLSNTETPTRKLLQIVLVGQPELDEKLKRRELRQLDQRIGIRCELGPLSRLETCRYLTHRLRTAGLDGTLPFSPAAMAAVFRASGGVPRLINLIADRALTAAFTARARTVTPRMVTAAVENLRGGRRPRSVRRVAGIAAALAAVTFAAGSAGVAVRHARPRGLLPHISIGGVGLESPTAQPVPPPAMVRPITAVSAPTASAAPVAAAPADLTPLVIEWLQLWGVTPPPEPRIVGSTTGITDERDLPAIARRYQLVATFLPRTSVSELRAIGLPCLLDVDDRGVASPHLLRRTEGDRLRLRGLGGEELTTSAANVEARWNHSAWILWRNADDLPEDPLQAMTPAIATAVGLRLYRLGYLAGPIPLVYEHRLKAGVRVFQHRVGLAEDGLLGPRTIMALARVVGGRFSPTLVDKAAP